jgi:hypothetical protein
MMMSEKGCFSTGIELNIKSQNIGILLLNYFPYAICVSGKACYQL